MSGPRDTRETAEDAGTAAVPADAAPPSFGGAAPPADAVAEEAPQAESASLKLPAFGLEAPWWAAESADTSPPEDDDPQDAEARPEPVAEDEPDTPRAEPEPAAPAAAPPGTLVAGEGVPSVDSRRAVPAEPIVKPPVSPDDTDPDGFKPIPAEDENPSDDPRDEVSEDAAEQGGQDDATAASETPRDETTPEETADDTAVDDTVVEGTPTPVSAFEKAKEAEDAAPLAPVLVPDAILPPGFVPPTGSGPFPSTEPDAGAAPTAEQPAVITPVYHAEGGVPNDTPPPPGRPPRDTAGQGGNKRRTLLIGGGAAIILAAAAALFLVGGTGASGEGGGKKQSGEPPPVSQSTPPATPSPGAGGGGGAPATRIDNEKTDPGDLAFHDVFPAEILRLGGRTFTRDRWSLNRDVAYAARGSMLATLKRERCRKIVRATYIDPRSKLAVTSGIAVMPTKAAALTVSKAGDPAKYEWFRGMAGKRSPDIDRAGGYAAATVRGRYVAYAYVQWANGRTAEPGDPTIKKIAQQFLDHDLRPIVQRAGG
ncbi:hypothetical protein K8Z49_34445 [Actinomadura madurae]|uniref:hypothetical protein n=1 Tax=Actinomadura madurae TaxID=1993 RepID=UPI00399B1BB7